MCAKKDTIVKGDNVIRKKRLTERGGIDWILDIIELCVEDGLKRTSSRVTESGPEKELGERRKGKADQLSFSKCFINNPLFGPQTQSGNSRVSPAVQSHAQPHPLSHTTPYQASHIINWPVLPYSPPDPRTSALSHHPRH
jgi:hypothetical protein